VNPNKPGLNHGKQELETIENQVMVEILTASGCGRCAKAKTLIREAITELDDSRIQYREVSMVEEIDYAIRLGVLSTPAIALNGELVFPSPPSKTKLKQAIQQCLGDI
jgi:glutaredoxin